MCLALFEKTPRLVGAAGTNTLGDGTGQSDARTLLRRGTGSGMAEVAFVGVDGEEWTARWEVRRSRGKRDGKLQPTTMALYRGNIEPGSESIVAVGGTKSDVLKAIGAKVGLNFSQFTRAVLLAQNDFAAFLKAKDRDRAEILQALTGTERYGAISKAVFQRCQLACQAVETARKVLESNPPLSSDQRTAAESASLQAKEKFEELSVELRMRQTQSEWLKSLKSLQERREVAETQHRNAVAQLEASESRKRELNLTVAIKSDAQQLRRDQKLAIDRAMHYRDLRQEALKALELGERKHKTAAKLQDEQQTKLAEIGENAYAVRKEILAARNLDSQLIQVRVQLDKALQHVAQTEVSVTSSRRELEAKLEKHNSLASALEQLEAAYEATREYHPLLTDWSLCSERIGIHTRQLSQLKVLRSRFHEAHESFAVAQERTEACYRASAEGSSDLVREERELQFAELSIRQFDNVALERERLRLSDDLQVLTTWKTQFAAYAELRKKEIEAAAECERLRVRKANDETRLHSILSDDLPKAESAWSASQKQFERIKNALDEYVVQFRHALHDGEPCPLCGALTHPFAQVPPTEDSVALQAAESLVQESKVKFDELKALVTTIQTTCQIQDDLIEDRERELLHLGERLRDYRFDSVDHEVVVLVHSMPVDEQLPFVNTRCHSILEQQDKIASRLVTYRTMVTNVEVKRRAVDELRESLRRLELERMESEKTQQLCEQNIANLNDQMQKVADATSVSEEQLREVWAAWPTAHDEYLMEPMEFQKRFNATASQCLRSKEEILRLQATQQTILVEIAGLDDRTKRVEFQQQQALEELGKVTDAERAICTERAKLLDGRNASEAELNLDQALKSAQDAFEQTEQLFFDADKSLALARKNFEDVAAASEAAQEAMLKANEAMDVWRMEYCQLNHVVLMDEDIDQRLNRDHQWVESERISLDQLKENTSKAEGELQACQSLLEGHLATQLTTDTEAIVKERLKELQRACADAQTLFEDKRATLRMDDEIRRKNVEQLQLLTELERDAEPWQQLNDLIGSSDGAKFRLIAQSRTLDLLLEFANQQMVQLSSRYRLERVPNSLNLVVIDCDMGDDIRSVHSLSGGESFLVSLALALGLASLTSDRVNVESLFIDEGFGSLDPETLNVAMGVLMQLESQGRKVGIISHVQEMTDAIPAQIVVRKGRRGTSHIIVREQRSTKFVPMPRR